MSEDTMFPADLILVQSSLEGVAYIQTSSLDGEKNFKKRGIPKDFNKLLPDVQVDHE
jgi:magnesium-transporting ATPase (P-type)